MRKKQYLLFSLACLVLLFIVSLFWDIRTGILDFLLDSILLVIETTGYVGITLAMVLDSAVLPIFPNEVIVPLLGFASSGIFEVLFVSLLVSFANVVGSVIAYLIGKFLGREFILDYGKYFFVSKKNLERAEKFFEQYGEEAIFFSRLMPAVKTIISFPAGIVEMDKKKFVYITFFGSLLLNIFLAFSGFVLGSNWIIISQVISRFELFFIGLGLLLGVFIIKYF